MPRFVGLLRAVNLGGRKVTMAKLKEAAVGLGLSNVSTLLASGNLVFSAKQMAKDKIETALEREIETTFGLVSEVMVRDAAEWSGILKSNPFPSKAREDPAHLVCVVCKQKPDAEAIETFLASFRARYDMGEQLKVVGREIYIDYGESIGQSKLILPRKAALGTARNWNTMLKLAEALAA